MVSSKFTQRPTIAVLSYSIFRLFNVFLVVAACRQMEFGVQAIFGPSDPILGAHIQSICEGKSKL